MSPRLSYDGGLDCVFEVLQHPIRRRVLVTLLEESSTWEDARSESQVEINDPGHFGFADETARTLLRHVHLPKLNEHGFISWDASTGTITHGPMWDTIEPVLSLLDDNRDALPGEWV